MRFQAYMIHFVTWGGDPKKIRYFWGDPKKMEIFTHPPPGSPLVNNERSLTQWKKSKVTKRCMLKLTLAFCIFSWVFLYGSCNSLLPADVESPSSAAGRPGLRAGRALERMGGETSHCPSKTCDARNPPKILRKKCQTAVSLPTV